MNKKLKPIQFFFVVTATGILLVSVGALSFNFLVGKLQESGTAITPPSDDVPDVIKEPTKIIASLELLDDDYTPTKNVLTDSSVYKEESVRLALLGKFSLAELRVRGTIKNNEDHYVIVNFGSEAGVLNGFRVADGRIDESETNKKGGLFSFSKPLEFTIDLLGKTILASDNKEFLNTKQGSKTITFWEYLLQEPPTIARLVIAPFNSAGEYGGAAINSIEFRFSCEEGEVCDAGRCQLNDQETESACIKRLFGETNEKIYLENVGY